MSPRNRKKSRSKKRRASKRARPDEASAPVIAPTTSAPLPASTPSALSHDAVLVHSGELLPRDEQLFERALTQWQFGDWGRLAALDPNDFSHHPRRARLALLVAAGHQQLGQHDDARRLARLAHEWGCDRTLIERVLISGVYNTLGRANALAGRQERARERLETALVVGAPGQDFALLLPARMQQQFDHTELPRLDQGIGNATVPAFFRCRLELDGQTRWLAFNPASPEHYSVRDGVLSFQLPPDKPGYLVSNETGDFNLPPSVNQLPLAPDTAYELSGHIACDDCEEPPVVWLFEYANGKKIKSRSFSFRDDIFKDYVKTQPESDSFAIGIRLGSSGVLDAQSRFVISATLEADFAIQERDAIRKKIAIITGIPRSGTSLFSVLLNKIEDVVCLNEILYNVASLQEDFGTIRRDILSGKPIKNKYNENGDLTTDTMTSSSVKEVCVSVKQENFIIASKVNVPYLFNLDKIKSYGFPIFVLVRDPVFTIASWSSEKAKGIPEAQVGPYPDPISSRWKNIEFQSDDPISRRAEIWNFLAGIILKHAKDIHLINYETLVSNTAGAISSFGTVMKTSLKGGWKIDFDGNLPSRFENEDLDAIRKAVEKYAPNRLMFGYR